MDRGTRIAVVGGGLAGLSVAGLLQQEGFPVKVYEQAENFSRIGAGIILSANPLKVLERLGLGTGIGQRGVRPDAYVSRAWDTGEVIYELTFDTSMEREYGAPYFNIHRADLHDLLQQPLRPETIAFGRHLVGLDDASGELTLTFANGATATADIVVGADGIRSKVREHLFGHEEPRFIGYIAPRAVFPASDLGGMPMRDCTKWWGPDRHILTYFMTARRDELYMMGATPAKSWDHEEAVVPGGRDDFLEAFGHFHPELVSVIEKSSNISVWPICDRPRDDRWSEGNVVLMGDACHAVRPFMASGGAMAIEDAAVLSRCIACFDDPKAAFRSYEATRIPRVAEVQRISIENSWMKKGSDIDWFFGYDPCTAQIVGPGEIRAPGSSVRSGQIS